MGPDEFHWSGHRYTISAYATLPSKDLVPGHYWLLDSYLTVAKYNPSIADVLKSERPEILARLRRVKAEIQRREKTGH